MVHARLASEVDLITGEVEAFHVKPKAIPAQLVLPWFGRTLEKNSLVELKLGDSVLYTGAGPFHGHLGSIEEFIDRHDKNGKPVKAARVRILSLQERVPHFR